MNKLFEEFSKPSYSDWVNQLNKDLKGQSDDLIKRIDTIEELSFNSFHHAQSINTESQSSLENPYIRNTFNDDNKWENVGNVIVLDELSANKKALELLNLGATSLRFEIKNKSINWKQLTNEIQLQYIQTTFKISSVEEFISIQQNFNEKELKTIFYELELNNLSENDWIELSKLLKSNQQYTLIANGYAVQQCGATTWQEIAYCLAVGHEYLVQLTSNSLTIDEAAACIHFNIGVGATYFYEIAKIRALRILWGKIIEEYQPKHNCSFSTRINGFTGFTNKSLKDPHTNLLRQTTESMSLIFGGVQSICVQPYDLYSKKQPSSLTTRMAINIPLILQEESYLDKVIDPLGGSYVVEYLSNEIAEKSWNLFQKIESTGGISVKSTLDNFSNSIKEKAAIRKQRIQEKTDTLIGINIFPNPIDEDNEWIQMDSYLNLQPLILEQSI